VIFTWHPLANGTGRIRYSLHLSLDEEFRNPVVMRDLSQPFAAVRNLFVGVRYYWKVVAESNRIHPVESEVWSFSTHPAMPRWVFVPGITNMRDLGGWRVASGQRVRQGAVYRSSAMSSRRVRRETADILLNELQIRTDLDLRARNEGAGPVLDETLVRWCHTPVPAYGDFATEEGLARYRDALQVFAEPANYPVLCHCRAGADRVGTIVVLLLGLLGVGLEDLALDYELTSLSVWGKRSRYSGPFQAILDGLKQFAPETDDIGRQIEGYVLAAGLSEKEIGIIRDTLLEPLE
jgi:protein-tyrosine phosphatase